MYYYTMYYIVYTEYYILYTMYYILYIKYDILYTGWRSHVLEPEEPAADGAGSGPCKSVG